MKAKKLCVLGILISLSMILSYVESLVNILPAFPGFKIGFANICVLFCLYKYSAKEAMAVLLIRVILVGFMFSSLASMLYSMAGALVSFAAMVLIKKTGYFSIYAVSTAGGVCHNLGQLIMAMLVLNTKAVMSYLPFLIVFGSLSGFLMGVISAEINNRIVTERLR